jgi:ABC-type Fe3+-hydroxamate transport system substrate-binding protein
VASPAAPRRPTRVVSLVPSATETLLALGLTPVACTRFCEQPGIPTVGGTKDPDVAAIVALGPDLVVVNDEENRREDADALEAAGLLLHSISPRAVADVGPAVAALAAAVDRPAPDLVLPPAAEPRGTAITFVWRRPWMVQAPDTYGASVLERLGWRTPHHDGPDRYPETDLPPVAALAPDLVVLPSEPYPFRSRHRAEVADAAGGARVVLVDGRDLFWWGIRTPGALARLASALDASHPYR